MLATSSPRSRRRTFRFVLLILIAAGIALSVGSLPFGKQRRNQALFAAIEREDADAVVRLLEQGADPNARRDPRSHIPIWQLLVMRVRGEKFTETNDPTPLGLLLTPQTPPPTYRVNLSIARVLLEHGANPNTEVTFGFPVLGVTAAWNSQPATDLLLQHGADVNFRGYADWTPLQTVVAYQNVPLLRYLLAKGADVHLANKKHNTAMSLAVDAQSFSTVQATLSGYTRDDPARLQAMRDGLSEARAIQANPSRLARTRAKDMKQMIVLFQQELARPTPPATSKREGHLKP